jgi:hypothetical protein
LEIIWFVWKASWLVVFARQIALLFDKERRHESALWSLYQRDYSTFGFAIALTLVAGPLVVALLLDDDRHALGIKLLKAKNPPQQTKTEAVGPGHWLSD